MTNDNDIEKSEALMLPSLKKENSFSVPQNYFDYLPQEIAKKIRSEKTAASIFILRPAASFASFIALCGVVTIVLIYSFQQRTISANDFTLSENDIEHIIDHPAIYNINETEIAERYLSLNLQDETNENMAASIPEEEIKNYLEESPDENTISNNY